MSDNNNGPRVVALPTRASPAVEYARQLLEMCESGEVTTFTAIIESRQGEYRIHSSGTADRFKLAGQLMYLVSELVGFRS